MEPIIGKQLVGGETRDAVHVAVMPVIAGEKLEAGCHVALQDKNKNIVHLCDNEHRLVGIIDPFLKDKVDVGDGVYLFLYPRTVEDMRHHWVHRDFPDNMVQGQMNEKSVARGQLERLLLENRCHIEVSEFISDFVAAQGQGVWVGDDNAQEEMNYVREKVAALIGLITGKYFEETYFRCAC